MTRLRLRPIRLRSLALAGLFAAVAPVDAQLAWTVFDEASVVPVTGSADRVTVTVPAGQRATLVATRFVPIDLAAVNAAPAVITLTFSVSGALGSLTPGTRAIGFGLFNHNGTLENFTDDAGYFVWLNGRSTGSLLELRRRNTSGASGSLLNPTGASFSNLGTGSAVQTAGALFDGVPYTLTLRLNRSAGGLSLGTGTSPEAAGVWLRGDGLSQTAYTNPDSPPAATQFNELAFMFFNPTGSPVTLTLEGVTGVTPANPPVITSQPAQVIVNPGQTGTLAVGASGTPPLSYQWRKDGAPLAGATNASLGASEAGSYSVVVSNAYGNAISGSAPVIVSATPVPATIETHPRAQTVNAGQPVTFTVGAYGSAPLTFEWQRNSAALPGATGTTLVLPGVAAADAGVYAVVVRNSLATVVSNPAVLTVNSPPAITTQPVGLTVNAGQPAEFSVQATGSAPLLYQWLKDGVPLPGRTAASLAFAGVTAADLGTYRVRITNGVGSVLSAPGVLTMPSTMAVTARAPAPGATAVNPDTPLRLTFDRPVRAGASGRIRIIRSSDGMVVDTLDLGAPATRLVGTNPVPYTFLPVTTEGNAAFVHPRAGALAYGQTYHVTMEAGVILDATGATFPGYSDPAAWRFSTRNAGPLPGSTAVTVAEDGSGDFSTVQGAIDFVPAGNPARVVITVRRGTYRELVYLGATKPFVTLRGEDRAGTVIAYPNNNNLNPGNNRAMVAVDASDFLLESITLRNTTPRGGSQAEALRGNGQRAVLSRVTLSSYQDTLLWNGTLFATDSRIEGDVDFMWGGGACYFQRCELKALGAGYYAQVRNGQNGRGHVYVDCRLTAAEGVAGVYLARIDPRPGLSSAWPYSQVVFIDCAMGGHIAREGWRLDNATIAPNVQFWEYRSTDLSGATLDVSGRLRDARQIDDATAEQYRDPRFVVGFAPQLAPAIEVAPVATTATAGANVRLAVVAAGSPAPAYQWMRNGVPIAGATGATLVVAHAQPGDAGAYAVRVANASGAVTSPSADLTLTRGPQAGEYFGSVAGTGAFALFVRDNGTAVFLGRGAGLAGTMAVHAAFVEAGGRLRFTSGLVLVEAAIDGAGNLLGSVGPAPGSGIAAPTLQFTGARTPTTGPAQAFAGYHQLRLPGGGLAVDLIVGATGQVLAVVLDAPLDAGAETVDAAGRFTLVTTGGRTLTGQLGAGTAAGSATLTTPLAGGNRVDNLVGVGDAGSHGQRLTGLATRARAGAGSGAAIVGFVISGDAPRAVVVRGVGPALASLGVGTALAAPKLDLYRGAELLATNTGWSSGGNATTLAAAFASAGLFALANGSADSALALTLAPGAYTATITGVGGATGNALVEIYDLAPSQLAQRISNLSTRAFAGRGEDTLIGGMIVAGTVPKRMLVRAVGPGLAQFGVGGVLARPLLTVFEGSRVLAANANWSAGTESALIAAATVESGAFALAPAPAGAGADAALVLNLPAGNYTAQVTGADGSTGVALLEIYELP